MRVGWFNRTNVLVDARSFLPSHLHDALLLGLVGGQKELELLMNSEVERLAMKRIQMETTAQQLQDMERETRQREIELAVINEMVQQENLDRVNDIKTKIKGSTLVS